MPCKDEQSTSRCTPIAADADNGKGDSNVGDKLRLIQRRGLLRIAAGGGSLGLGIIAAPKQWTRPVIDGILLPAHAQATLPPSSYSFSCAALSVTCTPSVPMAFNFDLVMDIQGAATGTGASPAGAVIELTMTGDSTDAIDPTDIQSTTITNTVVVQPDDSFAIIWTAPPPAGRVWTLDLANTFTGTLTTGYQDTATYGGATCVDTFTCVQTVP